MYECDQPALLLPCPFVACLFFLSLSLPAFLLIFHPGSVTVHLFGSCPIHPHGSILPTVPLSHFPTGEARKCFLIVHSQLPALGGHQWESKRIMKQFSSLNANEQNKGTWLHLGSVCYSQPSLNSRCCHLPFKWKLLLLPCLRL